MTTFNFNGHDFKDLLFVNDISRPIMPEQSSVTQNMGVTNGTTFMYNSFGEAEIKVKVTIIGNNPEDLQAKKQELAGLLYTEEPAKLIFSDTSMYYFMAIVDGQTEIDQTYNVGQGEITFIVPSGIMYANETKKYQASVSEGILKAEVVNTGTVETPLSIFAVNNDDNGYFSIVGPNSAMEFGKRDESDGHDYQQSDVVANNSLRPADEKNWIANSEKAGTYYPVAVSGVKNRFGEGSFSWAGEGPQPTFPSNKANCWVGPTLYREFGKNSNDSNTGNFEASWRCNFATKDVKEQMREEFNLMDDKGNVIFAVVLRDSSPSKREMKGEMMALLPDDSLLKETFTVDLKKATGTWYDIKVSRIGSTITFKVANIKKLGSDAFNVKEARWQTTKSLNVPELKDTPITATTYWVMANYGGRDKTPVLKESLTNFTFRWINVAKYSDDPNRYMSGDTLFYDADTGKYFVNDILTMNDIVQGSLDIMIPPGKHTVEFYYSDFCEIPPVVTAEIRERWL